MKEGRNVEIVPREELDRRGLDARGTVCRLATVDVPCEMS
jgi:hypothetical protein